MTHTRTAENHATSGLKNTEIFFTHSIDTRNIAVNIAVMLTVRSNPNVQVARDPREKLVLLAAGGPARGAGIRGGERFFFLGDCVARELASNTCAAAAGWSVAFSWEARPVREHLSSPLARCIRPAITSFEAAHRFGPLRRHVCRGDNHALCGSGLAATDRSGCGARPTGVVASWSARPFTTSPGCCHDA